MVSLNDPSERALWNLSLILREISEGLCSHVSGQEPLYQSQIEKTHFSDQIRQDELAKLKEVAYEAVPDETKLREAFKIESYENRLAYREAISRRIEEAGIAAYQQQAELEGILEFLNTDPVATYRGTMVVKPYISAKEIKRRIAAGEPVRKRPFKPTRELPLISLLREGRWPETLTKGQAQLVLMGRELKPNVLTPEGRVRWEYVLDELADHFKMEEQQLIDHLEFVWTQKQTADDLRYFVDDARRVEASLKATLKILDEIDVQPEFRSRAWSGRLYPCV